MHPKDVGGILDSAKHAEWLSGGSTPTLTEGRARGKNWGSRCASWAHSRGWCTSWWGYKRWFSWKYSEPRAKKKWNVPSRALILERGRNSGNEQRSRSGKNFCPNESLGKYHGHPGKTFIFHGFGVQRCFWKDQTMQTYGNVEGFLVW